MGIPLKFLAATKFGFPVEAFVGRSKIPIDSKKIATTCVKGQYIAKMLCP